HDPDGQVRPHVLVLADDFGIRYTRQLLAREIMKARFGTAYDQLNCHKSLLEILKLDESCISNPKSEISNRRVRFKISDFGFEMQDSSNFQIFLYCVSGSTPLSMGTVVENAGTWMVGSLSDVKNRLN